MFSNNLAKSNLLDRGELNMPSKEFVERMRTIHKCWSALKKLYNQGKFAST